MARRNRNPLDQTPSEEELAGAEGASGEGEGEAEEASEGAASGAEAAAPAPLASVAPPAAAAPPPPAPPEEPRSIAELDSMVLRVGYPVLVRRTGRAPAPGTITEVHEDQSLDVVIQHPPTWHGGVPICTTFVGRVQRARDEDPEAPGWLPVFGL